MFSLHKKSPRNLPLIGVGLRYPHYEEALRAPANIDFVEIHAENFFAQGGASHELLTDIRQHYQLSLHATSLGLGSTTPAPEDQLEKLANLAVRYQPLLVSDHACFTWAESDDAHIHAGDLLPVPFNDESLDVMVRNVQRVQNKLGRQILVENVSAYIALPGSTYSETEFLVKLCQKSDCKLLIDINNLLVNAINKPLLKGKSELTSRNSESDQPIDIAKQWLDKIPTELVGEIHLAGCTPAEHGEIMIDDHSQPVSNEVWQAYHYALSRFGAVTTLIEWDENLPSWQTLIAETEKARRIAEQVFAPSLQNGTILSDEG